MDAVTIATDRQRAVARYHPLLVFLHWGLAAFILAALVLGASKMAPMANTNPLKYEALRVHMAGGLAILVLMLIRLLTRTLSEKPAAAPTGYASLDWIAFLSHRVFYALVIAMPVTGLIMATQTGVIHILAGQHPALPASFWEYRMRGVHWLISRMLFTLIGLHVAGVLYHTFIRRDHLLRRMSFSRQRVSPWLTRIVLVFGAFLFTMIARKFVLDPVTAVRATGIVLSTPTALTTMRAGLGAFPLACAVVIVACLVAPHRNRTGLWFIAILIGVVLSVRLFAIYEDGTLYENRTLLTAEIILFTITTIALLADRASGETQAAAT